MSNLIDELVEIASSLGMDEQRVLVEVARRLRFGSWRYGTLQIDRDARCWRDEAREELIDAAVYLAIDALTSKR